MDGPVVIASWIITVTPGERLAARRSLGDLPGVRVGALDDPLVVTSECAPDRLGDLHRSLAGAPGVRTVSMVVAYSDTGPESAV